jgi:Flp pilus assembly pilin Flp
MRTLTTLLTDESGQGMTEYAILLGTLALGAILTLVVIGGRVNTVFNTVSTRINQVPTT